MSPALKHQLEPTGPHNPKWSGLKAPHELIPKDSWSFPLYKIGTEWAFNFWECQKFDEGLLNGSELALDYHFEQLSGTPANYQSEMYATFSLHPIEGHEPTATLTYTGEAPQGPKCSFYWDDSAQMQWWLCPLWCEMWPGKQPPQKGYLYLTLEN